MARPRSTTRKDRGTKPGPAGAVGTAKVEDNAAGKPASRARTAAAASEVFSVRLSAVDKAAISRAARAQGVSRNELIKRLVRHAVGELTAPGEMLDAWAAALRQLNGACNNLNQMTRVARRGMLTWRAEERADIRAVHAQADEVRRLLAAAVQTARAGRAWPERLKRLAGDTAPGGEPRDG